MAVRLHSRQVYSQPIEKDYCEVITQVIKQIEIELYIYDSK